MVAKVLSLHAFIIKTMNNIIVASWSEEISLTKYHVRFSRKNLM